MNLYICGNGFDLYHGLKTKYSDYKTFLESHYKWDSFFVDIPKHFENAIAQSGL